MLWLCSLDDEFGSQVSLWSSEEGGSFQQQLEQMDFEREESKAKYEELKVRACEGVRGGGACEGVRGGACEGVSM